MVSCITEQQRQTCDLLQSSSGGRFASNGTAKIQVLTIVGIARGRRVMNGSPSPLLTLAPGPAQSMLSTAVTLPVDVPDSTSTITAIGSTPYAFITSSRSSTETSLGTRLNRMVPIAQDSALRSSQTTELAGVEPRPSSDATTSTTPSQPITMPATCTTVSRSRRKSQCAERDQERLGVDQYRADPDGRVGQPEVLEHQETRPRCRAEQHPVPVQTPVPQPAQPTAQQYKRDQCATSAAITRISVNAAGLAMLSPTLIAMNAVLHTVQSVTTTTVAVSRSVMCASRRPESCPSSSSTVVACSYCGSTSGPVVCRR